MPVEPRVASVTPPRPAAKTDESKSSRPQPPAKPSKPKPLGWPIDAKKAEAGQNEWAKFLKIPDTTTNSIGMKLVLIPPGTFSMGNTPKRAMQVARVLKKASELERIHDELPQHRVSFNKPWLLATTEVTIGQFGRFVSASNYLTEAEQSAAASKSDAGKHAPSWRAPGYAVADDFPVTHVSWNDAVAFCNWLSTTEKLKPCYRSDGKDSWRACQPATAIDCQPKPNGNMPAVPARAANSTLAMIRIDWTITVGLRPTPSSLPKPWG